MAALLQRDKRYVAHLNVGRGVDERVHASLMSTGGYAPSVASLSDSENGSDSNGSDSSVEPPATVVTVSAGMEFDSFDLLREAVTRSCNCKLSLNCRKFPPEHALKWVKTAIPGLTSYHQSGCFYCFQAFNEINRKKHARTSCPMFVSYVFTRELKWKVTQVDMTHNHVVELDAVVGPSGIRYILKVSELTIDEFQAVNHWLVAKMSTRLVRYHFRQKFPGSEITRKCVRAARDQLKPDDPHAMDALVKLMERFQKEGGVGKILHHHFRIETIIMQHPLMRKVAQVFGMVTTVDGTHNTSKYDMSTLLNATCMDSFGKMAPIGCLYNESESEKSFTQLLNECGVEEFIQTLITDNSKAALAFIASHPRIMHVLCRWHWFKNFNKVMESVTQNDKKTLYDGVNKVIKWRG